MFSCHHCLMLSTILFGIVSPDSGLTILYNYIVNKIKQCGHTTSINPSFIRQMSNFSSFSRTSCLNLLLETSNIFHKFYKHKLLKNVTSFHRLHKNFNPDCKVFSPGASQLFKAGNLAHFFDLCIFIRPFTLKLKGR